ncbi:MAG: ABC transporter substrate-binding protein [Clostridiales bacterium]|nr:ABC transporter substrate-binding protein [Clostridiales bacterium]
MVLVLVSLVGCASAPAAEVEEDTTTVEEVPEGETVPEAIDTSDMQLTIYAGMFEEHAAKAVQQFEEETGIKTEFVRMSSGETLARIRAEKDNMTASVWYGGPADAFIAAKAEGLVVPYISPESLDIDAQFKDPEGYWTGIYVGYLGFVGNQEWLDANGLEMPQSWADLLKPEFKNEFVTAHPGSSGTAYTMLATVLQLMGEEEGYAYMQKLNEQVRQYTKSGTAPGRMIGMGEAGIGVTFLHDAIKYKEEGYKDIVISAPSEGTGYEIGAVAILANGPDQEAAKMFVDWALTKEAQELGQTVGSYQFHTKPGAENPEQAKPIEGTKLIDYDFVWAGNNRTANVEKFLEMTKTTIPTE